MGISMSSSSRILHLTFCYLSDLHARTYTVDLHFNPPTGMLSRSSSAIIFYLSIDSIETLVHICTRSMADFTL